MRLEIVGNTLKYLSPQVLLGSEQESWTWSGAERGEQTKCNKIFCYTAHTQKNTRAKQKHFEQKTKTEARRKTNAYKMISCSWMRT